MQLRPIIFALLCLMLAACTKAQDSTSNALDTVGNETSASYDKMRNYLDVGHKPKPVPVKPAQARYCYKTYQDVICYSKPLPGEDYRLVGFQTPSGETGYTLPQSDVIPAEDVLNPPLPKLKAVEVDAPPHVAGVDDQKQLKEIIFDPSELDPKELVPKKPE